MKAEKLLLLGIKLTSLNENIHVVHGMNRSRSPFANSILVLDKQHILIDTGCGLKIIETLSKEVGIDIVINSHSHPDHTPGNWLLQKISNPDIFVPAENIDSISDAEKLAHRFVDDELAELWKEVYLPVTGFQNFTPTASFCDGHEFHAGHTRFIALHTPGHLTDHYCLWEPDKKIMIGFDIDLSPFGPWYGNPESDIPSFKKSIGKIKGMPSTLYISSHAKPLKGEYISKRIKSYESVFDQRDEIVAEHIPSDTWVSLEYITSLSPIYNVDHSNPDKMLMYGESQMIKKHLEELVRKEKIIHDNGNYLRIK